MDLMKSVPFTMKSLSCRNVRRFEGRGAWILLCNPVEIELILGVLLE